jgi:hypothetical protein
MIMMDHSLVQQQGVEYLFISAFMENGWLFKAETVVMSIIISICSFGRKKNDSADFLAVLLKCYIQSNVSILAN